MSASNTGQGSVNTIEERMTTTKSMPQTWKAIKDNFPGESNRALRNKIFKVAQVGELGEAGDVRLLIHTVAFSNPQLAAERLAEIQRYAESER